MCIVHTDYFINLLGLMQEYPLLVATIFLAVSVPIALLLMLRTQWANEDTARKREIDRVLLYQKMVELQERLDKISGDKP